MRKAVQKTAPVNLGTKRSCTGCGTKFYDLGKSEIVCPKCETHLPAESLDPLARYQTDSKKSRNTHKDSDPAIAAADELATDETNDEVMESVDDLADEDVVESLEVDDEDEEEQEAF